MQKIYKLFLPNNVFLALTLIIITVLLRAEILEIVKMNEICEAACKPDDYVTVILHGDRTCFCDEKHGKWRNANLKEQND